MKSLFQSKYTRNNYTKIIRDVFAHTYEELTTPEQINRIDTALAEKAYKLGVIKLTCGKEIAVYETVLSSSCNLSRNRVGVRNLLKNSWKYYDGAFIASYKSEDEEWRFSFLSETKNFDNQGNYVRHATQAKRYTYLFGAEHPCRTANERFEILKASKKELKDIIEAFSVEALSKDFYQKLYNWYEWAIDPKTGITFPDISSHSLTKDSEDINVKIIRMITRILFVWFIKQKGLIPNSLFNINELEKILVDFDSESKENGNYYNAILQNLFFATLNRAVIDEEGNPRRFANRKGKRDLRTLYRYADLFQISEDEIIELFNKIPFLNGGLFECLDKFKSIDIQQDEDVYYDGFSRNEMRDSKGNYKYRAFVPNILFFNIDNSSEEKHLGLFQLLSQYNFTIEENATDDAQVSLDPELLGRVFENLLADYNYETQESARKATGSFYTPRIIVNYMVDESLIEYLHAHCPNIDVNLIRQVFDIHQKPNNLSQEQSSEIINAIKKIKILDPACGSGAFPMGCLLRMVEIVEILQGHSCNRYELKLHIIENCIFGVDIQPIAMLISKLRFFISLICEQNNVNFDSPETNYDINTLPNLETKFVSANTLISPAIRQYDDNDWTNDEDLTRLKNDLLAIRHEHFCARSSYKKQKIKDDDEAKRGEILIHILKTAYKPNEDKINQWQEGIAKRQEELLNFQGEKWVEEWINQQGSLFYACEPTLFRRDVNKEKREKLNKEIISLREEIKKERDKSSTQGFEDAVKQLTKWNPYDQNSSSPFFDPEWMFGVEDGFDIVIGNPPYVQLQNNGGYLAQKYNDCNYETFARTGDIYCLFYERGWQLLNQGGHLCYITSNKWMRAGYGEATRKFFAEKTNPKQLVDFGGIQVFESATVDTNILLFAKENNTFKTKACVIKDKELKKMSDYFRQHQIETAFSNGTESWVVLSQIERQIKEKIERIGTPLKDWDIQINYGIKTGFNEAFIIDGKKRQELIEQDPKSAEIIRPILRGRDIKRYSYEFADLWLINTHNGLKEKDIKPINIDDYPAVKQHLDKYFPQLEKRQDKGDTPYNLRNCAYIEDFYKQKIMYSEIVREPQFFLDNAGEFFPEATSFILTGNHLEYLCNMFNSKTIAYAFKTFYAGGGLGENGYRYKKVFFEKLPIPKFENSDIQKQLEESTDDIESLIFKLYSFTSEEIKEIIRY